MYIAPVSIQEVCAYTHCISISLSELLPAQYVSPALAWHSVVRHSETWL